MKQKILFIFILLIILLLFFSVNIINISISDSNKSNLNNIYKKQDFKIFNYSVNNENGFMNPDNFTRVKWIESYNNAPKTALADSINTKFGEIINRGNHSILSFLDYNPSERNQESCGNCWSWAATGCVAVSLNVLEGIRDRLSVQYINSCQSSLIGMDCCIGGSLSDFVNFYNITEKFIPWSNNNASWQDGDSSCDTECIAISKNPYYPIGYICEESIPTHNIDNNLSIANIKSVLDQNRGVWFAFYLPTWDAFINFGNFWSFNNTEDVYDIDKFCGIPYSGGIGHAVLCVGYNDEDQNNSYWIMLNSWGNSTNRPNGLFRINMYMNYSGKYPDLGGNDFSFYWETLNVSFDINLPEIFLNLTTNIEETGATLNGYLRYNGSVDTNCHFVWDNESGEPYQFNQSVGLISNNSVYFYNIENLSEGNLYYYRTKAKNIAGWNQSNELRFLTKANPIYSFNATMINDEKINLTWINNDGGKGAYIEYMINSSQINWNIGDGTKIDDDGYGLTPFIHTNLSDNTIYYYKAWSYSEDGGWFSNGNSSAPFSDDPKIAYNKTNGLIKIINENPINGSSNIDILFSLINATIIDLDSNMIDWVIDGFYVNRNNGSKDSNGSKNASLINPLPYNTTINWFVNTSDGINYVNKSYYFSTREKYVPEPPLYFSTFNFNRTQINLTWIKNNKSDKTYIRYKMGSSPPINFTDGFELGNFSEENTILENLDFGTQYSFKSWGWNNTDKCYSLSSSINNTITDENSIPFSSSEYPQNLSLKVPLKPICNVTVFDLDEDRMNVLFYENSSGIWKIKQSNISVTSGSNIIWKEFTNASNFSTIYWWSINITDGYSWRNETFSFKTIPDYYPQIPTNFDLISSRKTSLELAWTHGDNSDKTYVRYLEGKNPPINITDGFELGNFTDENALISGLNSGKWYTFRAWGWNETFKIYSSNSAIFSAKTKSSSGGGGGSSSYIPPVDNTKEDTILDLINDNFQLNLTENFILKDKNDDGIYDDFHDPNGVIKNLRFLNLSNGESFLLTIIKEPSILFIWNTKENTMVNVTYLTVRIKDVIFDYFNDSYHVIISVNKSDWIYFQCDDNYPNISDLKVYSQNGKLISNKLIWRENKSIFIFDDPETEYKLTYHYMILNPDFNPVNNSIFNISKPKITLEYYENVSIINAYLNDDSVNLTTTNNRIFIFNPSYDLINGSYYLNITSKDSENYTRTDKMFFTINIEKISKKMDDDNSLLFSIFISLGLIIIIIFLIFKYIFVRFFRRDKRELNKNKKK